MLSFSILFDRWFACIVFCLPFFPLFFFFFHFVKKPIASYDGVRLTCCIDARASERAAKVIFVCLSVRASWDVHSFTCLCALGRASIYLSVCVSARVHQYPAGLKKKNNKKTLHRIHAFVVFFLFFTASRVFVQLCGPTIHCKRKNPTVYSV